MLIIHVLEDWIIKDSSRKRESITFTRGTTAFI